MIIRGLCVSCALLTFFFLFSYLRMWKVCKRELDELKFQLALPCSFDVNSEVVVCCQNISVVPLCFHRFGGVMWEYVSDCLA
jgi:hypothetical protein